LTSLPQLELIEDSEVPLSAFSSGTASSSSGIARNGSSSSETSSSGTDMRDTAQGTANSTSSAVPKPADNETDTGSTGGATGDASGGGGGSTGGGGATERTWVPAWDERVWVDTSSYQSVYVGENPIYEWHDVCNDCGAIVDGFGAQHILETGHSGYHGPVAFQVGTEPIYEQQWVSSGYWNTIHHEGYWK
jgi:hypothetical protein